MAEGVWVSVSRERVERGGAPLTCNLEQVSCLICHLCWFLTSALIGVLGLIRGGGQTGDPLIFVLFCH